MKQLRFSTTLPMSMFEMWENTKPELIIIPENVGTLTISSTRGTKAYIHGDAENLAGFDIPTFIDGDMCQLDLPITEQDILMCLPCGEYQCKSEFIRGLTDFYILTLK